MRRKRLITFLICEAIGVMLFWAAHLAPWKPNPVIPYFLSAAGLVLCVAGLGCLRSARRMSYSGSGQWLAGEGPPHMDGGGGHSHGDCGGGHGGGDGGCGDGGGH